MERGLLNNPALLHSSQGEINLRNNLSSAGSSVSCPGLGQIASENSLHCVPHREPYVFQNKQYLGNKPAHDTSFIQQTCKGSLVLDNMHFSPKNSSESLEGKFRGTEVSCIEVADFVSQISRSTRSIAIASSLPNHSPVANHNPRARNPGTNRTHSPGPRGPEIDLCSPDGCTRGPDKQNGREPRGSEKELSSPVACNLGPDKQKQYRTQRFRK